MTMLIVMIPLMDNVISDTFSRPNQVGLGSTETGQLWLIYGDEGWGINGNAAIYDNPSSTEHSFAVVNTRSPNGTVSADITFATGASVGLAIRFGDFKNNFFARMASSGLGLFRHQGGFSTSIGNYAFTPVNGQTYNLRITAQASTFYVYLDNVLRITSNDTFGPILAGAGLRAFTAGATKWDKFLVGV